jgi:hypothetical protein
MLSTFGFNINLRRYAWVTPAEFAAAAARTGCVPTDPTKATDPTGATAEATARVRPALELVSGAAAAATAAA